MAPSGTAWNAGEVPVDLASDPTVAIRLCRASHARLLAAADRVSDEGVRSPSRLPGWTIAQVLSHLARNADGHARRLEGALHGEDLARYTGGSTQREADINEGVRRSAEELRADLDRSQRRLELIWDQSVAAGWPHADLLGDDHWPTTHSPARRLREVEMHHVDLGLDYEASDWPEEYVEWDLPLLLATVPSRVRRTGDAHALLAWLSGRQPMPSAVQLEPW